MPAAIRDAGRDGVGAIEGIEQAMGRAGPRVGRAAEMVSLVRDAGEATAVKMEHMTARSSDALYMDLRSGGGFVTRFVQ